MLLVILGIIIGILLSILVLLGAKRLQNPIERATTQLLNLTKERGEVFVDSEEKQEVENFIDSLPTE